MGANSKIKGLSLKWRILLPAIVVILITGFANGYTAFKIMSAKIEDEVKNRGASIALSLAQAAPNAILTEDYLTLNSLVEEATHQKNVVYAFITDEDNKIIAYSPKKGFDKRLVKANPQTKENEPTFKMIKMNDKMILDVGYTIKGKVGQAHVGLDMSIINTIKQEVAFKTTGIILAIMLVSIITIYFFANTIIKPILHLTEVANKISLGELDIEIDVNTKDEIETLAEAIERLRKSMKHAMKQLGAYK